MREQDGKRYTISEASEATGVARHLLRQWEARFQPMLHPKRNRAGRRYYEDSDIEIVRRIKFLLRQEGMTTEGARTRLIEELRGEGRPRSDREALDLVRKIEEEVAAMLDALSLGSDAK